jgi:DNA-binding LacI/PurR family transcriptional regulator
MIIALNIFTRKIADRFRSDIQMGRLKLNDKIPTELELAESYSVSRGTVRKALERLVQEGLFTRIKGKGTFVSGTAIGSRSTQIGVVVPWLHDHLISEMVRGVESRLREEGYTLLLGHSDGDSLVEAEQVERFLENKVAGIILFPAGDGEEYAAVHSLLPERFPLVVLDRRLFGRESDIVLCDNRGGAEMAVNVLIESGHRAIACLTPPSRPSSVVDRIRGYEQAMRGHNLIPLAAIEADVQTEIAESGSSEGALFRFSHPDFHELQRLLDSNFAPTALFCINDYLAFSLLEYLGTKNIKVPDDISIVGFDDHPFSSHSVVKLTSVAQDARLAGYRASSLLFERIKNPEKPFLIEHLPTRLVMRESIRTIS